MFDDDDLNDEDLKNIDERELGFNINSNRSLIGKFYVFLSCVHELVDIKSDRTPIIDFKGNI